MAEKIYFAIDENISKNIDCRKNSRLDTVNANSAYLG